MPAYALFEEDTVTGLHVLSLDDVHDGGTVAVWPEVVLDTKLFIRETVWHLRHVADHGNTHCTDIP
jgi:hypothetical protein